MNSEYTIARAMRMRQGSAAAGLYRSGSTVGELIEFDATNTILIKPKRTKRKIYIIDRFG